MGQARILILTASIGSGHTRAAEAIRAALMARPEAAELEISVVDFMSRDVSMIHYLMKRVYLTMLRFVPNLYGRKESRRRHGACCICLGNGAHDGAHHTGASAQSCGRNPPFS